MNYREGIFLKDEGREIAIYNGIKVKTIQGTGTFSIGKAVVKDIYSQTKSNISVQVRGDNNDFNINIADSVIDDSDGLDAKINDS